MADRAALVACPYCGMTGVFDPAWTTAKEALRVHYRGRCERLPWWRRWFLQ